MFKFYTKSKDENNLEAAVFHYGQRIMTVYVWRYVNGEITVEVRDGEDALQVQWVDYEETD